MPINIREMHLKGIQKHLDRHSQGTEKLILTMSGLDMKRPDDYAIFMLDCIKGQKNFIIFDEGITTSGIVARVPLIDDIKSVDGSYKLPSVELIKQKTISAKLINDSFVIRDVKLNTFSTEMIFALDVM